MKIAIGTPAYNAANYLRSTLDSVLAQTCTDWELIVVDDGSTDKTACIIEEYANKDSRIHLVRQTNQGPSAARNRSLEQMDAAEYVIFLDADDVWEPDALEVLVAALDTQPEAVAAHGIARYVDSQGALLRPGWLEEWGKDRRGVVEKHLIPWPLEAPTTFATLAFRQCIATPGVAMIRRAALEQAGPFDVQAHPCEDWDMWLRLSLQSDIAFVNRVLLNYRQHNANASSNQSRLCRGEYYVRRKMIYSAQMDAAHRRIAALGYRFYERDMFRMKLRFARENLAGRDLLEATKQVCRAARSYVRSLHDLPPS
jgi:glycosyltransferase involved in cell wall biosynthesis